MALAISLIVTVLEILNGFLNTDSEKIKMAKTELKQIKIKLVKSLIGASEAQRKVVAGLGLKKQNQVVEHYNSATILGMVNKVPHLVQIVD